jgi:hypothetical protein
MFNLEPLIQLIKEFNQHQKTTHQLLESQTQILTKIKELLTKK